jgi:hypothetical protein
MLRYRPILRPLLNNIMRRNTGIPVKNINNHANRIASKHKLTPKKFLKTTAIVGTGIVVIPIIVYVIITIGT